MVLDLRVIEALEFVNLHQLRECSVEKADGALLVGGLEVEYVLQGEMLRRFVDERVLEARRLRVRKCGANGSPCSPGINNNRTL